MDPNANLAEQLKLAGRLMCLWDACSEDGEHTQEQLDDIAHDAIRLGELVLNLNEWIGKGGFLPQRWNRS